MLASTVDFLKTEIERKRKERQELEEAALKKAKVSGNEQTNQPRKKYVKNADLEKERERKYLEEMRKVSGDFVTMIFKQSNGIELQTQEEKLKTARTSPTPLQKEQEIKQDDKIEIPLEEVFRRLRALGQPITLFGETEAERIERLRRYEEVDSEKKGGQRDEIRDILKEIEGKDDEAPREKKAATVLPELKIWPDPKEVETKEAHCLFVLKRLMKSCERDLEERSDAEKRSAQGKLESVTMKQCKKHLKPFFRLLRVRQVADDILNPIYEICLLLEKREYVKAHDSYLKMAIGNAPWPMGVTNVGIHERSAREKINSNQVAHVLNDETQRKYIQGVKRLMSYCQKKYPTDPSKTVG